MTLTDLTRRFWRRGSPTAGRHRQPEITPRPLDAGQITAAVQSLSEEPTALERAVRRHLDGETRTLDRDAIRHGHRDEPELVRGYVRSLHAMQGGW